jgi:transcriptional regulator with XRE-family HTH domain
MVHVTFPEGHGVREDSTRRAVTPELAEMLAAARRRRGWSLRDVAQNVGVSAGTIAHLQKARRAPSTVVAESIIRTYGLSPAEAAMLLAEAVEGAGWDSPFKRMGRLSMRTGPVGALYGAPRAAGRSGARLAVGEFLMIVRRYGDRPKSLLIKPVAGRGGFARLPSAAAAVARFRTW